MLRNKIAFIFLLILAFLFLQGCQDNITLPDTTPALQAPRLLYPTDDTIEVDVPAIFNWSVSRNATSYSLQIAKDSIFKTIIYDTIGLTKPSQQVSVLILSTTYYWRVNATNRYGTSEWSSIGSFTTVNSCYGVATVVYSGRTYTTVAIGSQCWFKKNIDVGTMLQGSETAKDNGKIEKYCYNNDPAYCNTYGGLYTWDEAMQYDSMEAVRGICPQGWHIPTYLEFQTLIITVDSDGNALKTIGQGAGGGAGTNTSGFSALLAGLSGNDGKFYSLGFLGFFYSSTAGYPADVDIYSMFLFMDSNLIRTGFGRERGFSIRCIKD